MRLRSGLARELDSAQVAALHKGHFLQAAVLLVEANDVAVGGHSVETVNAGRVCREEESPGCIELQLMLLGMQGAVNFKLGLQAVGLRPDPLKYHPASVETVDPRFSDADLGVEQKCDLGVGCFERLDGGSSYLISLDPLQGLSKFKQGDGRVHHRVERGVEASCKRLCWRQRLRP